MDAIPAGILEFQYVASREGSGRRKTENMKSKQKTKNMVLLALFGCIEIVLMLTPLGYIPIGPVRTTTLHIPVILAGVLMGPGAGSAIGLIFGISSVIINTLTPTVTSFVFSPFYSVGEFHGGLASLIIAIGPRVLLGWLAGVLFTLLMKTTKKINVSLILAALISTLTHTALVMLGIYVFFGSAYAAVKGVALSGLAALFLGVVMTTGLLEMAIGAVIVLAVGRVLLPLTKGKIKKAAGE